MSNTQTIQIQIQAASQLPTVEAQMRQLIALQQQQIEISKLAANQASAWQAMQIGAVRDVTEAIGQQTAKLRRSQSAHSAGAKEVKSDYEALSNQVRNFAGLVAAAFGINELKSFGNEVIQAKTKIDSLKIALDVMLGSKQQSNELFRDIVELAKTTPFTLDNVAEQTVKLKAYGIATNELIPTITALGNMASVVGTDKLPQLTLAYGQVATKGRLMGDEMRQFTEAGIPMYDLLAEAMKKPKEEVIRMANAHEIAFADIRKAVLDASKEGGRYYDLMALQAKTLGGEISNLSDSFFVAKARVGDYFEGSIRGGIKITRDLIEATMGSNEAISRSINIIGSVVTAVTAWKVASTAQATTQGLVTAATTAGNFVMGTYNLVMIAAAGTTDGFTAAQIRSAAAARSTWAVLASNPLGAIVAAVGLLVAGYMAWKAATEDVTAAMGEQEFQLRKEQTELNALVNSVTAAEEGTTRRKKSIEMLIQKYPDYFSGLNTEKTTNAELKGILDKVNQSYQDRIALARQAYQVDKLAEQQRALLEKEAAFFSHLSQELRDKYGSNVQALVKDLEKGKVQLDAFYVETAKSLNQQFKNIETSYQKQNESLKALDDEKTKAAIAAENARHAAVMKQLKDGGAEEKLEVQKHLDNIAKINGTYREKEANAAAIHNESKKKAQVISDAEIRQATRQSLQETLDDKIKAIEADYNAEKEYIKKNAKTKEEALEQIKNLYAVTQMRIADVIKDSYAVLSSLDEMEGTKSVDARKKTGKQLVQATEEAEKEIRKIREETAKINEDTTKKEQSFRQEGLRHVLQVMSQIEGVIGQVGTLTIQVLSNLDVVSGKALDSAQAHLAVDQQLLANLQQRKAAGEGVEKQIALQQQRVAESASKVQQLREQTAEVQSGVIMMVVSTLEAFKDLIVNGIVKTNQAVIDSYQRTREVVSDFYNEVIRLNEEALDWELENFEGSYEERKRIIDDFYAHQLELMEARDLVDAQIAYSSSVLQINTETTQKLSDVWDFKKGAFGATFSLSLIKSVMAWREHKAQIEANEYQHQAYLMQLEAARIEYSMKQAKDQYDAKIEMLKQELDAFKAAKEAEIDAENEALAERKRLTDQFYNDKAMRLQADDVYRNELLQQGEAREIAALEAAKQRELDRATSAEESTRIINAFEQLKAEVHNKYQTAIGDKTKEVSLANEEIKAQEADRVAKLEKETKDLITKLREEIARKDREINEQMKAANQDYKNSVNAANREIFELNKQMQIAMLKAEIATLRAKRWFGNAGKINSAIDDLWEAIGTLEGLGGGGGGGSASGGGSNPGAGGPPTPTEPYNAATGEVVGRGRTASGQEVMITFNPSGKVITVYDDEGQPIQVAYADGFIPETGERFFKGSPYVMGKRFGIDTIPAMINEGERIVPTSLNTEIGGAHLTNEALVEKVKGFDRFAAMYPQLITGGYRDVAYTSIQLPEGILNSNGGNSIDVGQVVSKLDEVRKEIRDKQLLGLSWDRNGFSAYQQGAQSKINHYSSIIHR